MMSTEIQYRQAVANLEATFAGLQTPLADVVRERLPGMAPELETEAIRRQEAREAAAAARRAEKDARAAAPAVSRAVRPMPEVRYIRRRQAAVKDVTAEHRMSPNRASRERS